MKIIWSIRAIKELKLIEKFISADNEQAAKKLVKKIVTLTESVIEFPEKGRVVPEISIPGVRELIHKNYRIVYRIEKKKIIVITVFESHRLLRLSDSAI